MAFTLQDMAGWEKEKDSSKFIQILNYLFEDQHIPARAEAVKALANMHYTRGMHRLLKYTVDLAPEIADAASNAMVEWGKSDLPLFCSLVEDEKQERNDRYLALKIVFRIPDERKYLLYLELIAQGIFTEQIIEDIVDNKLVNFFVENSKNINPRFRYASLIALQNFMSDPAAVNCYLERLFDPDVQVKLNAYRLVKIRIAPGLEMGNSEPEIHISQEIKDLFVQDLQHEDHLIRKSAAMILYYLPDERALSSLFPLLEDQDEKMRNAAVRAIKKIPNMSAFPVLADMFAAEPSLEVCRELLSAAASTGHKDVFKFLEDIVETNQNQNIVMEALNWMRFQELDEAVDYLVGFILREKAEKFFGLYSLAAIKTVYASEQFINTFEKHWEHMSIELANEYIVMIVIKKNIDIKPLLEEIIANENKTGLHSMANKALVHLQASSSREEIAGQ